MNDFSFTWFSCSQDYYLNYVTIFTNSAKIASREADSNSSTMIHPQEPGSMSYISANTSLGATSTPFNNGGILESSLGAVETGQPAPAYKILATAAPVCGTQAATPAYGCGAAFKAPTAAAPAFGAQVATPAFRATQGAPALEQQEPTPISPYEPFAQAIYNVSIFGDERDHIIAKWNYLQAMWGTGKLFYAPSAAPVDITPENHLCRFKAIGYSRIPRRDTKLGLVALKFDRKLSAIKPHQQHVVQMLHSLFGSQPNMLVHIDSIKEVDNTKCQMVIYLEKKLHHASNESHRILATELSNYLNQPSLKPHMNDLGIVKVFELVLPDEEQLKEYLENPPRGVDPCMWLHASFENPNARQFIPVPVIGFNDLMWRLKCQEHETNTHALYMKKVETELTELGQQHSTATARILEHSRKLAELGHRVLRIIVQHECSRMVASSLTPEEEAMRTKLQDIQAVVSAPSQFNERACELLSQMRGNCRQEYAIGKEAEEGCKQFLTMQQNAMEVLNKTVKEDVKALDRIIKGLPKLKKSRRRRRRNLI